jgi:thymidylate synthase (FAD)
MVILLNPSFSILSMTPDPLLLIENAGRTAYQSFDRTLGDGGKNFVEMILKRGHESVIEHASATVRFIHNRGFTHELVRHRLASFTQESTRYCNYSLDKFGKQIRVIVPHDCPTLMWLAGTEGISSDDINRVDTPQPEFEWMMMMIDHDTNYQTMINDFKKSPQTARGVLPNDLKTEIVMTANFREWRHVFSLRDSPAAHPDMQRIMAPLHAEFRKRVPVIFDEVQPK